MSHNFEDEILHHRLVVQLRHVRALGQLDVGDAVEQQAAAPQQRVALQLDVPHQLPADAPLLGQRAAQHDLGLAY